MASRLHSNRWPVGVAFCMPLIVGLSCLMIYPVFASFYFSLTDYPIFDPPKWRGLSNYAELFGDPRFYLSVWNTTYFALLAVPLGMFVGLILPSLRGVEPVPSPEERRRLATTAVDLLLDGARARAS